MRARIIVTGGAGFIGGHTIEELQNRYYDVLPLDVRDSVLFPDIKVTKCDINSPDLSQYIEEGDKILHLCAVPIFEGDPTAICRVNIEGIVNLVQAALKKKAERIVFASSGAVYFGIDDIHPPLDENTPTKPNTYYGFSKIVSEQILDMNKYDLPYIALRYGYIFGRGAKGAIAIFLDHLLHDKRATVFWGKQFVENVYVKDIVQANIKALISPHLNEIYNIGTGNAISIRQIYDICALLVNKKIEPIIKPLRPWDPPSFYYNINKAVSLLGYSPKWTLTEGIKDMLNEMRKYGQI